MTFAVTADAYDRHVGRYGAALGGALVRAAGVEPGWRVLDVGSGPGALTSVLAGLVGAGNVSAVEPSAPFVTALQERQPDADVRQASAEELPFPDASFDAALAQLVVNFLRDPEQGVGEMRRVCRPGGVVAACVWDYPGEMTLLKLFWDAAFAVDPERAGASDERATMGFDEEGELADLWRRVGLENVEEGALVVAADYESFEALWEPFEAGVGPSGAYAAALPDEARTAVRDEYRRRLGKDAGPFTLHARAWYAVGTA